MSVALIAIFVTDDQNPAERPVSQDQALVESPAPVDLESEKPQVQEPSPTYLFENAELRPLARLFLYGSMAAVLYFFLNLLMYYLGGKIEGSLRLEMIAEVGLLVVATAPAVVLARLEGRPWGAYGLPSSGILGKLFWSGIAWGLVAISLLMLALEISGAYGVERPALHGLRILKFAVYWGGFFLVVGLFEEFLMRGYSQFTLSKTLGFWPSALLLSVGFAVIHLDNPGETARGIVAAGAIGFFFCLTLQRTGNLWFAVGFHASWDWSESFLYSVPNSGGVSPGHLLRSHLAGPAWLSGGRTGPEGSLLVFVILVLLWFAFDRTHREVKYQSK